MSWIKLDDQWMDHPKIIRAGRDARDMWLASITWCAKHLTDGYFPPELLPALAVMAGVDVANCQTFAKTLLDLCLWDATDTGYMVHDYLEYNPTKEQTESNRIARSEAGKRGGLAKASKMPSKPLAKPKQNPGKSLPRTRTHVPAPEPVPAPKDTPGENAGKPDPLYSVACALSEVTGLSLEANKPKIFKEAKALAKDATATPERIRADYGAGGLWYLIDWRGKRGQPPELSQVRGTWGTLRMNGGTDKASASEPKGFAALRSYAQKVGANDQATE